MPLNPRLVPCTMESRGGLLAACEDRIAFSADGASFEATFVKTFEDLGAQIPYHAW